jgi:hypothetical protein
VFHTVGWLTALRRTYGYEPVAFTTSSPAGELENGLVFCHVNSWLTGRRLVSLPFSDHCEPLCDSVEEMHFLLRYLRAALDHREWKYFEIRPVAWNLSESGDGNGLYPAETYFLHALDLRPDVGDVFRGLDKDSVQRRVRRAQRAGLVERCGNSKDLLEEFYRLFVVTRSRHRVPPSPYAWFRNLVDCQGQALEVRLAYKDKTPVAGILTLQFRDIVYYKYGCSDARFNKLGATPWLLWRAIEAAKSNGATEFDLGRTEEDNPGLLEFKNHWVPKPKHLVYCRFPAAASTHPKADWKLRAAKYAFAMMPSVLLRLTGRLLYRHAG